MNREQLTTEVNNDIVGSPNSVSGDTSPNMQDLVQRYHDMHESISFGDVKLANTSLACPFVLILVSVRFQCRFGGDYRSKCHETALSVSDLTMCFSQVNALVDFGNASTFRRACLSMMARAPMTPKQTSKRPGLPYPCFTCTECVDEISNTEDFID